VEYWNAGATRIFGYSAGEALGQQLGDLVLPPASRAQETRFQQMAIETGSVAFESSRRRKDRSTVHVG